jgi:chaperone modulatory protein CbpM
MDAKYMVAVNEFCASHEIEISFIGSLRESGLIEITKISEGDFIKADQLKQLEKFMHLYYDLDINLEGIETINYLLQRMNSMDDEIRYLRNKLRLYENAEF